MDYLLKSTICLTAFYGLYFFGFRRMSFHALNRFYLLVSLALSLTIPLLSYERTEVVLLEPQPIEEVSTPIENIQENTDNQASTIQSTINFEKTPDKTIDWIQMLNIIYLLGVGVMMFIFIKNLLTIFYVIKKASFGTPLTSVAERSGRRSARSHRKLKILLTKSQSNSSFFNYVFLNPENLNPHEEALIIAHEGFHAQRLHTLDLLLLGILKAVFWFNPIVYFYQKSLKQIHEYEVDALMSATFDGREYAHLLLKLGVAPNAMIINQFSTKPLSERIKFLFTKPTKNMKKLLYFLSLPIIAVGVMAFAEEKTVKVYQVKTIQKSILKKEQKTNLQLTIPLDTTTKKRTIPIDIFTHKIDFNLNSLINVRFFSVDATNPNEPPREWFSLPDSVKIFADDELLILYKDYILGGTAIAAIEKQFLNATFKFILPNNKTVFKATAKRKTYYTLEPIEGFFERRKFLNDKGEKIEKVTFNKPLKISTNGEGGSLSATLAKDEKILYLVDNKVVEESFIAKADEDFMKKVFQMNAADSDLVSKFGERAKGFDNVFCIWTTDLTNKK